MKKIISFLFITLSFFIASAKEPTYKEVLYLANRLMECRSQKEMDKTCLQFDMTPKGTTDGFLIFSTSKGIDLKCRMDTTDNRKSPVVEIKIKQSQQAIVNFLTALGYEYDKTSKVYLKGNRVGKAKIICKLSGSTSYRTLKYSKSNL